MGGDEPGLDGVEQARPGPAPPRRWTAGRSAAASPGQFHTRVVDVVERDREGAHAEGVDGLQLGRQRRQVGRVAVADRHAGRDGEGEPDVVGGGRVDELRSWASASGG